MTACWGDIKGSAVAAEVRIDGVKANEADALVLDGDPVTLPALVPVEDDPLLYVLSGEMDCSVQQPARLDNLSQDKGESAPRQSAVARPPAAPPLPPAAW
ncbi:hypothetical protein GCM10010533_04190 [Mycolicibacterium pallens]